MPESATIENSPEFLTSFQEHERQVRISTGRWACWLVIVLMPFGTVADRFVYPDRVTEYFIARLVCSMFVFAVWMMHSSKIASRFYPAVGMPIVLLPSIFLIWMVYDTRGLSLGGAASPYYAAFTLILLAVSAIGRWSMGESMFAVASVIGLYVAVTFPLMDKVAPNMSGIFFINLYFLVLTGVVVLAGNYLFNRLRYREFVLRYELDANRRQLEETNQKLLELDQIKGRFFANISHELRTPLTLLIAPLENLRMRFGSTLDPETNETLQTMQANAMRLLKLINDLLDLVRLESGRLEVRQDAVVMADFVRGLSSAARQVANDKRLKLETHTDPNLGTVVTDRDKLEKIVLNLLFNALKFTPAGGRVELRAELQSGEMVLTVADTGMGISEKNLPHVFDRFWQADGSSKRKYQGVGIGLALVKELVEVQKGNVKVTSQEGKGTTFTIRLPHEIAPTVIEPEPTALPEPATNGVEAQGTVSSQEWLSNLYRRAELFPSMNSVQESLRPVETSAVDPNRPTLLVADDEPDMLRFLKTQLSTHYRVVEAVDGQQAVDKAGQFLPDIIILDMMMPEKDGLQACREIRERTSTHNIPIVLLTARGDEQTKLSALQAGASDFLTKPFSTTELHVRIKNLVDSHEYQRKVTNQKTALESTLEQLKDTETQLVQSEKLASLGRMSAGIIHEINNPLNFATTGVYALKHKLKYVATDQQEEYADILKDVEEGIARVKNIVTDLRMFSHPETESRDQVEVTEVVKSALRFLSGEWRDRVNIEQHLDANPTIWANKNKLIHVVLNLLQNSLDALRTKKFPAGEGPTIRIESRVEGGCSRLIIRDNGPGIENKNVDKIFDPFFTTKDVGEGMGLGLSICYRIVQNYDGRIMVRTEPGKFCEFTLEFPIKG